MTGLRVFTAPSRYVQGPGALDELGGLLAESWSRAAILVDADLTTALTPRLLRSLAGHGVGADVVERRGEVTRTAIDGYASQVRPSAPEVVVAVGGGKTLDSGKGVSVALGVEVVTVPTIASNDGPTSRIIAEYDAEHRLVGTPQMTANPAMVVVDTDLVAAAPPRFLLSGIGDAIAKRFEAAGCRRTAGRTPNGTLALELPSAIADACYRTLVADADEAVDSLGRLPASPALERVIEAVILMSGLAFENGGLSLAHALTRGLMRVNGARDRLHGFQVAYGLLVQLAHEGDRDAYCGVDALFARIGLPRRLGDLGATVSDGTLAIIAEGALTAPHCGHTVPTPTPGSLIEAMTATELAMSERR